MVKRMKAKEKKGICEECGKEMLKKNRRQRYCPGECADLNDEIRKLTRSKIIVVLRKEYPRLYEEIKQKAFKRADKKVREKIVPLKGEA